MRPDSDTYFMKIALVTAERSTCLRHHVGTVVVIDKHILSGGYNGAPAGHTDCLRLGCLRNEQNIPSGERTEICRAVHSEENAIIQAALFGVSIKGATVYCTHSPCRRCAKMLVNARIAKLFICNDYKDDAFGDLFLASGIPVVKLAKPSLTIEELV